MSPIHPSAAAGFAAGAQTYLRGRPDYPAELDLWLRKALDLGVGRSALDLGAGTGKFLPRLRATGARLFAVEPVAEMREQLAAQNPDIETLAGFADAVPLPDASLDAVVCAQAFHWFATERSLAEIARVLRPGGALGLIWNVRDESVAWVRALTALIAPFEGDAPRFASGRWRDPFPSPHFGPLVETRFPHAHVGSVEEVVVARLLSTSFIAALDAETRAAIAERARAIVAAEPSLTGRPEIAFPYETRAYAARKL